MLGLAFLELFVLLSTLQIWHFERQSKNSGTNKRRIDRRTRITWKSIEALAGFHVSMHRNLSKQD